MTDESVEAAESRPKTIAELEADWTRAKQAAAETKVAADEWTEAHRQAVYFERQAYKAYRAAVDASLPKRPKKPKPDQAATPANPAEIQVDAVGPTTESEIVALFGDVPAAPAMLDALRAAGGLMRSGIVSTKIARAIRDAEGRE